MPAEAGGAGDAGPRGLASAPVADVVALVGQAWDAACTLAAGLDLDRPSRRPGRSVRDVLVPLGSWPEHERFSALLDGGPADGAGQDGTAGDGPLDDDTLAAVHAGAGTAAVTAALRRARDGALALLSGPDGGQGGRRPVASPVGPLPLTCAIAASCYDLAVHALDVADADDVPGPLLTAGIAALVDVTGALAARSGTAARFAVRTPQGGWACVTRGPGAWTTSPLDGGPADLPLLEGAAADVLDASAGRRSPVPLLAARRLRLHDAPGLMALLPVLEAVPGLPGGAALRTTARVLGGTGRLVGRLGPALRR